MYVFNLGNKTVLSNTTYVKEITIGDWLEPLLRLGNIDTIVILDHGTVEKMETFLRAIASARRGIVVLLSYMSAKEFVGEYGLTPVAVPPVVERPKMSAVCKYTAMCNNKTQDCDENALACVRLRDKDARYLFAPKLFKVSIAVPVYLLEMSDFTHAPWFEYHITYKAMFKRVLELAAAAIEVDGNNSARRAERLRPYIDYAWFTNAVLDVVPRTMLLPLHGAVCETGINGLVARLDIDTNTIKVRLEYKGPIAEVINRDGVTVALPEEVARRTRLEYWVEIKYSVKGSEAKPAGIVGRARIFYGDERYPHENVNTDTGEVCLGSYSLPALTLDSELCGQIVQVAREVHAVLSVPNASSRYQPGYASMIAGRLGSPGSDSNVWQV